MATKQAIFANGEIYHLFNRGVEKRITFIDKKDLERFVQTLDYYRFDNPPSRFSFRKRLTIKKGSPKEPLVEILAYCLMPNHFHLLVKQLKDKGITNFVSKVTNSYTKYFNTRYKRTGPLFQGTFKAVRIEDDEQLIHVSRYIHLNPLVDYVVKNLKRFPYSSYPEYLGIKKGFCQKNLVLDQFPTPSSYEKFVLDQEDYGRKIKQMERLFLEENQD